MIESWFVFDKSLKPNYPWRDQNSLKSRYGTKKLQSGIYRPKFGQKYSKARSVASYKEKIGIESRRGF